MSDGEEVSKGQILLVLDDEILKENVNSLKNQLNQVKVELELKKEEKIKLNELYRSKLKFLNNEFNLQDEIKIIQRIIWWRSAGNSLS